MTVESSAVPEFPLAGNDQVVCTLYEGDYHKGVAALVNSIVKGGFRGMFWIGHRGEMPPWVQQLTRRQDGLFKVGEALLGFEKLEKSHHFAQYKPDFMQSLFDRGIARDHLWYFDPDITVRCEWSFYERWARFGVCLCQEMTMGGMASDHPLRREWVELAANAGWGEPLRLPERYFSSGFVGLPIACRNFLALWSRANLLAAETGVRHDSFFNETRVSTFYSIDQDTMNIALMYGAEPLSTLGPEGMGFEDGGFTMYHAAGMAKSWKKDFVKAALKGIRPWNGDKHFLECADGPIRIFSARQLKRLRRSAALASLIGRFYRRG